jgi:hypothetical protein
VGFLTASGFRGSSNAQRMKPGLSTRKIYEKGVPRRQAAKTVRLSKDCSGSGPNNSYRRTASRSPISSANLPWAFHRKPKAYGVVTYAAISLLPRRCRVCRVSQQINARGEEAGVHAGFRSDRKHFRPDLREVITPARLSSGAAMPIGPVSLSVNAS